MSRYCNPAMKQLTDQQVRYAPLEVRVKQIARAENVLGQITPDETYYYHDLCKRVTSFRPELYPDLIVSGDDAIHDLRCFIEDVSDSVDIPAETVGEPVLTVDDVSRRYNVSTKTVDR